jgi:hypothetical protein
MRNTSASSSTIRILDIGPCSRPPPHDVNYTSICAQNEKSKSVFFDIIEIHGTVLPRSFAGAGNGLAMIESLFNDKQIRDALDDEGSLVRVITDSLPD